MEPWFPVTPVETNKLCDDDSIKATRARTVFIYMEGASYIARLCVMRTMISRHHLTRATTQRGCRDR